MPSIESPLQSPLRWIVAYPRTVLIVCLLGAAALGWQARHFQIDASADTLLMRDDPHYVQTRLINSRFSPQEFLLIGYQPTSGPLLSDATFRDLKEIRARLRKLERVESVRTILDVPLFARTGADVTSLEDSRWTLEQRSLNPAQIEQAFRGHPIYEDLLINQAQTATALQVLFRSDPQLDEINAQMAVLRSKSLQRALSAEEQQALSRLERRAQPIEQSLNRIRAEEIETIRSIIDGYADHAQLYLGGVHVLAYQLIQIIKNDLLVFSSAIAATICLILLVLFRKLRWVLITVVCCGSSVLATVGLFGLLGFKTTVISSNFIVLQLILTLAIVIHLIVQYREYCEQHPDWSQAELVKRTLQRKASPCFFAGITTSVGFASLLFSGLQPVVTFGWMMMLAMGFSIAVSLVMFPAIMSLYQREQQPHPGRLSRRVLDVCSRCALRHPVMIGLVGVGVLVASVMGLLRLDVENSFINYFKDSTRVHQELAFIDRQLGGSTPLDLVYSIHESERKQDLVMTADTVQLMQRVQHRLTQHDAVGKILSVVNFTEVAKTLNQDKPLTEYELTAVYWTLEDALRRDLLGAFFDPQRQQIRFSVRIQDTTAGLDRAELLQQIHADMHSLGIPGDRYTLSNLFVLYQDILQRLYRSQILTLGIVYGALTLIFVAIFRSIKIALIGVTPNILSTLAVLGVMGWLGIALDLMTITIVAIAMGIAVDDTIHYIHRYREELRGAPAAAAIERTHLSVGHAVLDTTLIVTLGFSLLALSDFIPSVLFGLLTGFAMLLALLFALCLLPVLLERFARNA